MFLITSVISCLVICKLLHMFDNSEAVILGEDKNGRRLLATRPPVGNFCCHVVPLRLYVLDYLLQLLGYKNAESHKGTKYHDDDFCCDFHDHNLRGIRMVYLSFD
jgi:hypothetical protein